jgi:hypothetical protein
MGDKPSADPPDPAADKSAESERAGTPEPQVPDENTDKKKPPSSADNQQNEQDDRAEQNTSDYLKRIADDEQEWRQRQESLNKLDEEDREAAAELGRIGRDSNNAKDNARIFTAGRDIRFSYYYGEQALQISYLSRDQAALLEACMVEPQSQAEFTESLNRNHLVFLRGTDGSGRFTAAVAALLSWLRVNGHGTDNGEPTEIGIIQGAISALKRTDLKLRARHGYIFEVRGSLNAKDFEVYADNLKLLGAEHDCRIVVTIPAAWQLAGQIIDHHPPAAAAVFYRWLEHEAHASQVDPNTIDELKELITDDLLDGYLGKAAQHARSLVTKLKAGRTPADVCEELPGRARADIRHRLDDDGPVLGRCFMTSVAVLNGLPETTVSAAAMSLAEKINSVRSVKGEQALPAWQHLGRWLDYAEAATRPGRAAGGGPTVHLKRGIGIERLTLQVLWEDQPTIRQPLTAWLSAVAESQDSQVRTRAAHAVGILATFDFDAAVAHFISPWSRSRRPRDHRLAAMALESAVLDPKIAPHVHQHLRSLVNGTDNERLTAAHAFGSRIGIMAPQAAMQELRKITLGQYVKVATAVAGSIGDLYSVDTAELILTELKSWVDGSSSGGRYTAALAFVRLAVMGTADPARPPLTELRDVDDLSKYLSKLWLNSLYLRIQYGDQYPELVVPDSWKAFERWVIRYRQDNATRSLIDSIFGIVAEDKRLRHALMIHLRVWRQHNVIDSKGYENFMKIMKV